MPPDEEPLELLELLELEDTPDEEVEEEDDVPEEEPEEVLDDVPDDEPDDVLDEVLDDEPEDELDEVGVLPEEPPPPPQATSDNAASAEKINVRMICSQFSMLRYYRTIRRHAVCHLKTTYKHSIIGACPIPWRTSRSEVGQARHLAQHPSRHRLDPRIAAHSSP